MSEGSLFKIGIISIRKRAKLKLIAKLLFGSLWTVT